ncbi:hypothetical protein SMD10_13750 [Consotaella sp. CSK11QG-6]
MSFGSELFRRVVAAVDGQPSESVLAERDRLRAPEVRLEQDERLLPIVDRINQELRGFFRTNPTLHLRVTPTDFDGLLESVVSHYAHYGADVPLPAIREVERSITPIDNMQHVETLRGRLHDVLSEARRQRGDCRGAE